MVMAGALLIGVAGAQTPEPEVASPVEAQDIGVAREARASGQQQRGTIDAAERRVLTTTLPASGGGTSRTPEDVKSPPVSGADDADLGDGPVIATPAADEGTTPAVSNRTKSVRIRQDPEDGGARLSERFVPTGDDYSSRDRDEAMPAKQTAKSLSGDNLVVSSPASSADMEGEVRPQPGTDSGIVAQVSEEHRPVGPADSNVPQVPPPEVTVSGAAGTPRPAEGNEVSAPPRVGERVPDGPDSTSPERGKSGGVVVGLSIAVVVLLVILVWVVFVQVRIWNALRSHMASSDSREQPPASVYTDVAVPPAEEVEEVAASQSDVDIDVTEPLAEADNPETPADTLSKLPGYRLVVEEEAVETGSGESASGPGPDGSSDDTGTDRTTTSTSEGDAGQGGLPLDTSGDFSEAAPSDAPELDVSAEREDLTDRASVEGEPRQSQVQPQVDETKEPARETGASPQQEKIAGSDETAAFVDRARQKADTNLEEDRKAQEQALVELNAWNTRLTGLRTGLQTAVEACGAIVLKARESEASLPEDVRARLHGRQDGLDLIEKMLRRLGDRVPSPSEVEEKKLLSFGSDEVHSIAAKDRELGVVRREFDSKLKLMSNENYQQVSQIRTAADNSRKSFLGFIERQVLPILDGVDDGDRSSDALVAELRESVPEVAETLSAWFECYDSLRTVLLDMLGVAGVTAMVVARGDAMNYERHEAFDVEPDPELANERIKCVTRNGYEVEDGGQTRVLRPAQVTVVKN